MTDTLFQSQQSPPTVTVQDIYESMGLLDVDDFLALRSALFGDSPRQVGASTWMAAHAAVQFMQGNNIAIIDGSRMLAETNAKLVADMVRRFSLPDKLKVSRSHYQLGPNVLVWNDQTKKALRVRGSSIEWREFHEHFWRERLRRRIQGPFAMIREIRQTSDGRIFGMAEDDEIVMELTEEGARAFQLKNPHISVTSNRHHRELPRLVQ